MTPQLIKILNFLIFTLFLCLFSHFPLMLSIWGFCLLSNTGWMLQLGLMGKFYVEKLEHTLHSLDATDRASLTLKGNKSTNSCAL